MDTILQYYLLVPIPLRIAYFLWFTFISLYLYAGLHDKYHSKVEAVKIKEKNFNAAFTALAVSFVLLNQIFIWNEISIEEYISGFPIFTKLGLTIGSKIVDSNFVYIIGGLFMVVGLVIAAYARAALNGYWNPNIMEYEGEHKKLITYGIYSIMRHPIFLSQFFLALGTAFLANSWFVLFFPIILSKINWERAKKENALLEEMFGNEFIDYKNKVHGCGLGITNI